MSATISGRTAAAPVEVLSPRRRRRVDHLFFVHELEHARAHGLRAKSLCGLWRKPGVARPTDVVPVIGDWFPVFEDNECKSCRRGYSAYIRSHNDRHPR